MIPKSIGANQDLLKLEVDFIKNAPPCKVNARPSANPGKLTYDNLRKNNNNN
jgi:hypothetical protein